MATLPPTHSEVAVEATRIASSAGRMDERADALVECLHRAIRFDAAWLGVLDPERRGHLAVLDRGYDHRGAAFLNGPHVLEEMEAVGLHRWRRAPLRHSEALSILGESQVWQEYLGPAGFRDGLGTGLFHSDGRYLGVLALHAETAAQLTDDDGALLALLTPTIAAAV